MNAVITTKLKYVMSTIKKSFAPAFIFAVGLVFFYANHPYAREASLTVHTIFYALAFLGLLALGTINRSKPFFTFLTGTLCYMLLNWCKNKYGSDYQTSYEYLWICFALPINLAIFYFLSPTRLQSKQSFILVLCLLFELMMIQHFGHFITQLAYLDVNLSAMPMISAIIWLIVLFPLIIDISLKNTLTHTGLFYADSCLFLSLLNSDSSSGLATFFLCFVLILYCTTAFEIYHQYNLDSLDQVGSYNSYISHAGSKFPYKYTVGLFSIDNRDKLLKILGESKILELEQMLVNRIFEFPHDLAIYRYLDKSELIIVFKNENAKHTMEYAENIRHEIAVSEFVFTNGKNIKITISISVSEKTRLDLNANDVTARAHNALQKLYRFNCNMVTKA